MSRRATRADIDARVPGAGALARRRRLAAPRGRRHGLRRCGRDDRHARHLPHPRNAGAPRGAGRLRLRDAGPRLGRDQPGRQRASRSSAGCRGSRAARRSPPSRCPSPTPAPTSRRCSAARASTASTPCSTARRRGSPTAASPTSTSSSHAARRRLARHRRAAQGLARHLGLHRRGRHAGLRDRRAHRRDRAASAGAAALHELPRAAGAAHRRRGRGLQGGDAHARRVPHLGRRGRARLRAPRPRRGAAARDDAAHVQPDLADFQLTQAKLAQMATTIDSAALLVYRAAWQRDQGRNVTKEAAMAKMVATEGAQQVIDAAVQIFGGLGVVSEQPVERLYREIRCAAHLRRRDRGAAAHHRARAAEGREGDDSAFQQRAARSASPTATRRRSSSIRSTS